MQPLRKIKGKSADYNGAIGRALSVNTAQRVRNLEIVDPGTRSKEEERGYQITLEDLGRPKTDGTNDPGASAWTETFENSSGNVKLALFGAILDTDTLGSADVELQSTAQFILDAPQFGLGLNLVSYMSQSNSELHVWGVDTAGKACIVKITGDRLFNAFKFFQDNPTSIELLKLNMSNKAQAALSVTKSIYTPFKASLISQTIRFSDFDKADHYKENLLQVPLNYVIDSNSALLFRLLAGGTTTITMYAGDIANIGKQVAKIVSAKKGLDS